MNMHQTRESLLDLAATSWPILQPIARYPDDIVAVVQGFDVLADALEAGQPLDSAANAALRAAADLIAAGDLHERGQRAASIIAQLEESAQ